MKPRIVWGNATEFQFLLLLTLALAAHAPAYDPLSLPGSGRVTVEELTVKDEAREREIPLRVYLPGGRKKSPVAV